MNKVRHPFPVVSGKGRIRSRHGIPVPDFQPPASGACILLQRRQRTRVRRLARPAIPSLAARQTHHHNHEDIA
ncbi:hypothetical protein [Massilia sp. TN1-12]|uniref:hypothetical protein n=1 Tax=Massilia paldalensis TaxID=3377675 RepID=UPI00384B9DD0